MKIYELYPVGEAEDVEPISEDDYDLIAEFDGTPRAAGWRPVPVRIVTEDIETDAPLEHADVPWMGSYALFLRDKAIETAGPLLEAYGELLPLECATATVVLFNPTTVLDALDEERSGIERFPGTDRIMAIERYAFRADAVPERAAFRIPQDLTGPIYYTEPLVEALNSLGLAGLAWHELGETG